jgi:hypothetical protein
VGLENSVMCAGQVVDWYHVGLGCGHGGGGGQGEEGCDSANGRLLCPMVKT